MTKNYSSKSNSDELDCIETKSFYKSKGTLKRGKRWGERWEGVQDAEHM